MEQWQIIKDHARFGDLFYFLWHAYPYSTKHSLVTLICKYVIKMWGYVHLLKRYILTYLLDYLIHKKVYLDLLIAHEQSLKLLMHYHVYGSLVLQMSQYDGVLAA